MPESTISVDHLRALILSLFNEAQQESTLNGHENRITALENAAPPEGGGGGPLNVIFVDPEGGDLVLTPEQTGSVIVLSDGFGIDVRLPTSDEGLSFTFVNAKGNDFTVRMSAGDEGADARILLGATEVWAAYSAEKGAVLTLVGMDEHAFLGSARRWYATSIVGTWAEKPA